MDVCHLHKRQSWLWTSFLLFSNTGEDRATPGTGCDHAGEANSLWDGRTTEGKEESLRLSWKLGAAGTALCLGENTAKVYLLEKTRWSLKHSDNHGDAGQWGMRQEVNKALEETKVHFSKKGLQFPFLPFHPNQYVYVGTCSLTHTLPSPFLYISVNSHAIVGKTDSLIRRKPGRKWAKNIYYRQKDD